MSGSEDGRPHLWFVSGIEQTQIKKCDFEIDGPVADVAWSKNYNMIAMCGFGDEYPIVIYCHEKEGADITAEEYKNLKDELRLQF